MGGASVYIISCLPPHLRFLLFSDEAPSSLTLRWCRDLPLKRLSSRIRTSCSDQLADSVIPCGYPVRSKKAFLEEQISGFERPVTSELTPAQCPRASPSPQRERAFVRPLHSTWSASLHCERHDLVRCEWRQNRWQPFFLAALDAEGSVTDPALLPSSSSRNTRLRADEEIICIMTEAVNELGLKWFPPRSHLTAGWMSVFSRGAIKPPANACPPSSSKFIRAHDIMAHPPTHLASILLLQLLSHPLTVLKKKDTSNCLLWMSLWPHISAHTQLLDGRRGRAIRPSRAKQHLHSLDAPTQGLDKRLQRFTRWLCFRSSRPSNLPMRKPV